jgi:tyrosine decarboxylase/aspartate 1-decarboxylase
MPRATISTVRTNADILTDLEARLATDWTFQSGRVLGSMCSVPHPVAAQAFERVLEANIGDEGLVPALAALEREAVATFAAWWGRPGASGRIVTGGTEANVMALWTAKVTAGPEKREVVIPASAHYSFDKAASLMDLTLVKAPVGPDGRLDAASAEACLTDRTCCLVGVAGTTALGAVDDVYALAELARRRNLYFHLDASFGGYVLPFLADAGYPSIPFGWPEGLSSLSADPHKMGRGPVPSGMVLWKDQDLAQVSAVEVGYLSGGRLRQNTLVGTRSGASVAAVWAVQNFLGRAGYADTVRKAMDTARYLTQGLVSVPGAEAVFDPTPLNVVGVRTPGRETSLVVAELRRRGWALSQWDGFFRVVCMPHVTPTVLDAFLGDLKEVLS